MKWLETDFTVCFQKSFTENLCSLNDKSAMKPIRSVETVICQKLKFANLN